MVNRFDKLTEDSKPSRNRFDKFTDGRPSSLESFASGAGDAISFGFGDELLGIVGGGFDEEKRNRITNWSRIQQEDAQGANPWAYGAGQLGGSIASGFGVGGAARLGLAAAGQTARFANMARGTGLLGRLGAAGATGATGGAIYGAGSADGEDVAMSALEGAAWGAPTAILGQGAGEVLGRVAGGVRRAVSPEVRASHVIGETLDRFGQTPQEFQTALAAAASPDAPQGAMAVDVIRGAPEVLKGAAVRPSAGKLEIRDTFDARNNNLVDETAQDLWDTLGTGLPKDAADRVRSLGSIQKTQAAPLYDAAYKQPLRQIPKQARDFLTFQSRKGARFNSALEQARESMRRELGADVNDAALIHQPRFWHTFLHNVEEQVGRSYTAAKMDPLGAPLGMSIAEMTGDARKFNDVVRGMLGKEFRDAQDIYAGAARSKMAEEFGQDMVNAKGDLALGEVTNRLGKMTKPEREHAMSGAISALEEKLRVADTETGRADVLRSIIGNKSKRRVLNHIFGNAKDFDNLTKRLDQRRSMFRTSVESGVGVNSHTAPLFAAQQAFEGATNPTAGSVKGMILKMLTGDATEKYNEAVSNRVIELMQTPASQLQREIASAGSLEAWLNQKGLLQAALRQQQKISGERPKALANAALAGLYTPIGGESASDYAGF